MYDKGGWVFWMLLNHMGRDRALAGLQDFIRTYETNADHAVLQDLVAVMRTHAADTTAFDAFVDQWFFHVVVPEYRLASAKRVEMKPPSGGSANELPAQRWQVSVEVQNTGTGVMPVDVAAFRGERFPKEDAAHAPAQSTSRDADRAGAQASGRMPDAQVASVDAVTDAHAASDAEAATTKQYQESRRTVTLGPGENQTVTIVCGFKPDKVVVDPDAKVLMLNRDQAVADLK